MTGELGRVAYIIDDTEKLISIIRIAHRREVYER
jgi:mRNA-degrading endonuclease RelE of RelBE toxin-antitoxin system